MKRLVLIWIIIGIYMLDISSPLPAVMMTGNGLFFSIYFAGFGNTVFLIISLAQLIAIMEDAEITNAEAILLIWSFIGSAILWDAIDQTTFRGTYNVVPYALGMLSAMICSKSYMQWIELHRNNARYKKLMKFLFGKDSIKNPFQGGC